MTANELSAGLAEKVNEYRMMSAPLDQAMRELEFAQSMLRARAENDIAQTVPALGALSEILEISSLDLLMAPDRMTFIQEAMRKQSLSPDEIGDRIRNLVDSHQSRDDLKALGIGENISP
jgi:hypothetical protein